MQLISGIIPKPKKVVIYGPEGVGKSTLAAQFPKPVFIDTEGSTTTMNVLRVPRPTSLAMIIEEINWIIQTKPDGVQTIVLDTADWAERLCRDAVLSANDLKNIEAMGYGKAYSYVWEEFGKIISAMDRAITAGLNAVITAHAALRKFEQPDEAGAYDRWELKLQNSAKANIAAMVKEWADMILFCNYETTVYKTSKKDGEKTKAAGGNRVMYTTHHPCWDAKNRFGLPEKIPMEYRFLQNIMEPVQVPVAKEPAPISKEEPAGNPADNLPFEIVDTEPEPNLPRELLDLMAANRVTDDDIKAAVVYRGYFPEECPVENYPEDFIKGCLIAAWPAVLETIKTIKGE